MTQTFALLLLAAFGPTYLESATPRPVLPLCAPVESKAPQVPQIQKVERSPRQDGVWHLVSVKFEGQKQQRYHLEVKWEAQTLREDGQGTTDSKVQWFETDGQGRGEWQMEVRGYPAGQMRARVTDSRGIRSEWSPNFEVPWIY